MLAGPHEAPQRDFEKKPFRPLASVTLRPLPALPPRRALKPATKHAVAVPQSRTAPSSNE